MSESAAINEYYAVLYSGCRLHVRKLISGDEETRYVPLPTSEYRTRPFLALSIIQPHLLAVSTGAQILIFDISTNTFTSTIPGTGRTITALSWSHHDCNVLAAGNIDGSINLWNIDTPSRPTRRLGTANGPCQAVGFHPSDKRLLTFINHRRLYLTNLQSHNRHSIHAIDIAQRHFEALAWQPLGSQRLLAATSGLELKFYSLYDTGVEVQKSASSDSSEDDEGDNDNSDDRQVGLHSVSLVALDAPARLVQWCNDSIVLVLSEDGLDMALYQIDNEGRRPTKVWSHTFVESVETVHLQFNNGVASSVALGRNGIESYDLPASMFGLSTAPDGSGTLSGGSAEHHSPSPNRATKPKVEGQGIAKGQTSASMNPTSIAAQRLSAPSFAKTSKQLQRRRLPTQSMDRGPDGNAKNISVSRSFEPSTPPTNRSMTSSLELPKSSDDDFGSPMPFLSPTIPSRRLSPNDIPPLDDNTFTFPLLATSSPESPIPSTATEGTETQDSDDSDDETFVDAAQGSATFLPGGINVPLPKACGALFAPNGQLLTFFPPKSRTASAQGTMTLNEREPGGQGGKGTKTAKLFPTFGNLASRSRSLITDTDSESLDSSDGELGDASLLPNFLLQPSSFPSQQSWKSRISLSKPGFTAQPSQHKITVSVYEANDVPSISTTQCKLAENYRLLRSGEESGSDVCEHNALVADAVGLHDVAHIWHLLAMLLNDKVPLEALSTSYGDDDVLTVAKRSRTLSRSDSGVDFAGSTKHVGSRGRLRWSDHPFGGLWLVRKILQWAENRSDTQMLASISAVLAEDVVTLAAQYVALGNSFLTKLTTYSKQYTCGPSTRASQATMSGRSIPVLRTSSVAKSSSVYESPTKFSRPSNTSSRNASQPTTPYLDSSSSTPPLSLPSLSRQGTRTSASGSVSPEYQRSSFSTAAKYYAQSITDKFASYGTSPPTKKADISPSTNELSSSLPSGSWGKSVSFAASSTTTNTARGSLLSRSFDYQGDTDAYESDGTVQETGSSPQTPKSTVGAISVVPKNQHLFTDEVSGCAEAKLIPEDLSLKGYIWCQYYAEQLRTWGMQTTAAELEKIVGITNDTQASSAAEETFREMGILPVPFSKNQRNNTCSICLSVIRRMEQVCPSCHHICHLDCLNEYSDEISEGDFTCPTGCGCACAELACVIEEPTQQSPQAKPTFKKKASFTDPRRWRARAEGDSW